MRYGLLEMAELGNRLSKEEYAAEVEHLRPALLEMQLRLRAKGNMAVPPKPPRTVLDKLDLSRRLDKADYSARLGVLQGEIHCWGWEAFERGVSAVAVFEGWDAAGKGGCIRRLTAGLDARNTRVVSIASPTDEEKAHPYLWRFWRHLPTAGSITVFDRSWYGRVLVERVEGYCWPEDWRNREKWNAYLKAADEMLGRTSTSTAPWTLVAAEDKLSARLQVLETLRDALRKAVKASHKGRSLVRLT